jgi:3-phosphoshikimate 1-carboxyvinyltransferase
MKAITITKADRNLAGSVQLPSSKSISNRLLIIRALTQSGFTVSGISDSDDTLLLKTLLTKIREQQGHPSMTELDTANAGTVMRFLTAYLSMVPGKWVLTGSERMKQRPIGILVDGLKSMGAQIDYLATLGYPPLLIHGTSLKGREIIVDPGISSQFVSALIMIGPKIPGGLTLHLSGPAVSFPYVKMTIGLLKAFGIHVVQERSRIIHSGSEIIIPAIIAWNRIGRQPPSGMKRQHWLIMWIWNCRVFPGRVYRVIPSSVKSSGLLTSLRNSPEKEFT